MTARSVLASTLLGVTPPELPTRSLVATAALLGIPPGTARVALSRMVTAGELEPVEGGYRLRGPLLDRQTRQGLSVAGPLPDWDGTWSVAIVTGEARPASDRAELRAAMTALRHAELREGVWLRPANLPLDTLPAATDVARAQTLALTARPEEPTALARSLWDLDGWTTTARALLADLHRLLPLLARGDTTALAEAFLADAAALRHLQADPLLPPDLLPREWPGADLRQAQQQVDEGFKVVLAAWQRDQDGT